MKVRKLAAKEVGDRCDCSSEFTALSDQLVKLEFCSVVGDFRLACWEEFSNGPLSIRAV